MAEFDVRSESNKKITKIIFSDGLDYHARYLDENGKQVFICSTSSNIEQCSPVIEDKEHAQNLIKALNKAIELGFV